MGTVVFIGDELSAVGFRLAGLEVPPLGEGRATNVLAEARQTAGAILMTAAAAAGVHKHELDEALLALIPPAALVPDILGVVAPPDLAQRLKAALGIETYEDALFE
jgi:vacuolar-type H+-ATPase subunit F/Vma7